LDKANYDRILQIYRERFADASNFKAVFIGNIDMDELRPMLCKYLATLPATKKEEKTNEKVLPQLVKQDQAHLFRKKMATPLANVTILHAADVEFSPKNDLTLDFLKRVLQIAYTDSVREEKGGTYGVRVDFSLERDDNPTATLRIAYNADPTRYEELNPIVYQQLEYIAKQGPSATAMQKISTYLTKQYDQFAITNDYWSYIIWHELDDEADFDKGYKELVAEVTAADVQNMARKLLDSKCRIEVTMLSK
jgi:zinc protease